MSLEGERVLSDEALAIVTLMQEAAGECYEGKVAVAEVIRRRTELDFQSDGTIPGTVLRSYAFSGWNSKPDFLRIRTAKAKYGEDGVYDCAKAWRESETSQVVPGAVYYCNLAALTHPPAWATGEKFVKKIGHHSFFRS